MSIRMRHTRGHTGNRRSHHALKNKNIVTDKESGNFRLPHRLDEATGMYRGKLIVTPRAKATKVKEAKHAHVHTAAAPVAKKDKEQPKSSKGLLGKLTGGAKPKARSGAGGGGA